jgi:hypothetical protein
MKELTSRETEKVSGGWIMEALKGAAMLLSHIK